MNINTIFFATQASEAPAGAVSQSYFASFCSWFLEASGSPVFSCDWFIWLVLKFIFGIAALAIVMTFAALSVVAERKVCAFIQGRLGPNTTHIPLLMLIPVLGKFLQRNGLQQLIADALKFLLKEEPMPAHVKKFWYVAAPVISLSTVLISASLIPFGYFVYEGCQIPLSAANIDYSLLVFLAMGGLGIYGAVLAGWSSNNKYSYLGGIRASAQMISYELTMVLSLVPMILWLAPYLNSPLSIFEIAYYQQGLWNCIAFPLSAILFLTALFAETNRQPFDMAESETDLVSGYHTEYGAFKFGLFFVGEYGHLALGSGLFIALFMGAWSPFPGISWPESWGLWATVLGLITFLVKIAMMIVFFIWVRWTLPRFRYDHVMNLGWSKLLPLSVLNLLFYLVLAAFIK